MSELKAKLEKMKAASAFAEPQDVFLKLISALEVAVEALDRDKREVSHNRIAYDKITKLIVGES